MSTNQVLDLSIQADQLREKFLAADPEPPHCTEHGGPRAHSKHCAACRTYDNWRSRLYKAVPSVRVPRTAQNDPEPAPCPDGHTDPNRWTKNCEHCRRYVAWRARDLHRRKRAGQSKRFTDIPRLVAHINALEDAGLIAADIAEQSGVSIDALAELRRKRPAFVRQSTSEKILAVPVPERRLRLIPTKTGHLIRRIDATGTHRRIRCAQYEGHGLESQATRLGWAAATLYDWLRASTVSTDVADAVALLYPHLIDEPGPSLISRSYAVKAGCPGPRYYCATNIDDPQYDPFRIIDNPYGVYRRLRALAYMAQGSTEVGAHIDEAPETVELWMEGGPAPAYAHHLVVGAYEALSATHGPDQRAADRAQHAGWGSPFAWEGIDIDKPTARFTQGSLPGRPAASIYLKSSVYDALDGRAAKADLSHAELVEVVTIFHRRGWSDQRIAVWLRWNPDGDADKGQAAVTKFREPQRNNINGFGALLNGGPQDDAVNGHIVAPSAA